jgi:hypothetical protein
LSSDQAVLARVLIASHAQRLRATNLIPPDRAKFALLCAALAADEAGAAAIVDPTDLLALVFALAAWCNPLVWRRGPANRVHR